MNLNRIYRIAFTAIVFASSLAATGAFAQQPGAMPPVLPPFPVNRTITVFATGSATAPAERVSLGLTVSSADKTATALFVKQNDIVMHLKESLENAGIKSADITEQPFHLMPNMEYGQDGTRIIGYRLDTPLQAEIDNVKDLPRIIDLATQSGASAISIGTFGLAAGHSLENQAVKNAIENARAKAGAIAEEMGKKLGDIVSVSETGGASGPLAAARLQGGEEEHEAMMKAAQQPNTLTEQSNLKVVFEVQ